MRIWPKKISIYDKTTGWWLRLCPSEWMEWTDIIFGTAIMDKHRMSLLPISEMHRYSPCWILCRGLRPIHMILRWYQALQRCQPMDPLIVLMNRHQTARLGPTRSIRCRGRVRVCPVVHRRCRWARRCWHRLVAVLARTAGEVIPTARVPRACPRALRNRTRTSRTDDEEFTFVRCCILIFDGFTFSNCSLKITCYFHLMCWASLSSTDRKSRDGSPCITGLNSNFGSHVMEKDLWAGRQMELVRLDALSQSCTYKLSSERKDWHDMTILL